MKVWYTCEPMRAPRKEMEWICKGHQINLCLSSSLYIQPLLAVNAPWVIKGQNSSREVLKVFHEFWLWLSMCLLSTCLEIFITHCLSAAWRFWSLNQSCWNYSCFSLLYFNNACWTLLVLFFPHFIPYSFCLLSPACFYHRCFCVFHSLCRPRKENWIN